MAAAEQQEEEASQPTSPRDDDPMCTTDPRFAGRGVNCDENCLNRLSLMECTPHTCALARQAAREKRDRGGGGDGGRGRYGRDQQQQSATAGVCLCTNQHFKRRQRGWKRVAPFNTGDKWRGWGLRTQEQIREGEFVIEFVGEVIDRAESERRVAESSRLGERDLFLVQLSGGPTNGLFIDCSTKGNASRFLNHSCAANCEIQVWSVNGEKRVGLFALPNQGAIKAGTELTCDYRFYAARIEPEPEAYRSTQSSSASSRTVNGVRSGTRTRKRTRKADEAAEMETEPGAGAGATLGTEVQTRGADAPLAKGTAVLARFRGGCRYWPGHIDRVRTKGGMHAYDIQYDDGDHEEKVTRDLIRVRAQQGEIGNGREGNSTGGGGGGGDDGTDDGGRSGGGVDEDGSQDDNEDDEDDVLAALKCRCGAANCSGYFGYVPPSPTSSHTSQESQRPNSTKGRGS